MSSSPEAQPWAYAVPPFLMPEAWAHAAPLLAPAVELDEAHTLGDVRRMLDQGTAHLWLAGAQDVEVAAVCLLQQRPRKRIYTAWLCGGEGLEACRAIDEAIKAYARCELCDEVVISGREGWLRVLDGYEKRLTVMRCKL